MFVDCWPAITWSVVDYFRKPKKGYFTLQKVFSPLYMILTPPREEFSRGSDFFGDIAVVNDYHREFKHAEYHIQIKTPFGKIFFEKKRPIDIPPDDVKVICPFGRFGVIRFPADAELGEWKICGTIKHKGKVIAKNEETFQLLSGSVNK
jgi:beta-mannosidase